MPFFHLDTNIIIDLVLAKRTLIYFKESGTIESDLATSLVCVAEFLTGANSQEKRTLRQWIDSNELAIIGFSSFKEAQLTADIRRKTGLRLPDAIILSTAIQEKAHLLTNDQLLLDKAQDYISVTNPLDYE